MICYKDMTFCDNYKTCKDGKDCHRALTPEDRKAADKIGLPVCRFSGKPTCYKEKKKDKK